MNPENFNIKAITLNEIPEPNKTSDLKLLDDSTLYLNNNVNQQFENVKNNGGKELWIQKTTNANDLNMNDIFNSNSIHNYNFEIDKVNNTDNAFVNSKNKKSTRVNDNMNISSEQNMTIAKEFIDTKNKTLLDFYDKNKYLLEGEEDNTDEEDLIRHDKDIEFPNKTPLKYNPDKNIPNMNNQKYGEPMVLIEDEKNEKEMINESFVENNQKIPVATTPIQNKKKIKEYNCDSTAFASGKKPNDQTNNSFDINENSIFDSNNKNSNENMKNNENINNYIIMPSSIIKKLNHNKEPQNLVESRINIQSDNINKFFKNAKHFKEIKNNSGMNNIDMKKIELFNDNKSNNKINIDDDDANYNSDYKDFDSDYYDNYFSEKNSKDSFMNIFLMSNKKEAFDNSDSNLPSLHKITKPQQFLKPQPIADENNIENEEEDEEQEEEANNNSNILNNKNKNNKNKKGRKKTKPGQKNKNESTEDAKKRVEHTDKNKANKGKSRCNIKKSPENRIDNNSADDEDEPNDAENYSKNKKKNKKGNNININGNKKSSNQPRNKKNSIDTKKSSNKNNNNNKNNKNKNNKKKINNINIIKDEGVVEDEDVDDKKDETKDNTKRNKSNQNKKQENDNNKRNNNNNNNNKNKSTSNTNKVQQQQKKPQKKRGNKKNNGSSSSSSSSFHNSSDNRNKGDSSSSSEEKDKKQKKRKNEQNQNKSKDTSKEGSRNTSKDKKKEQNTNNNKSRSNNNNNNKRNSSLSVNKKENDNQNKKVKKENNEKRQPSIENNQNKNADKNLRDFVNNIDRNRNANGQKDETNINQNNNFNFKISHKGNRKKKVTNEEIEEQQAKKIILQSKIKKSKNKEEDEVEDNEDDQIDDNDDNEEEGIKKEKQNEEEDEDEEGEGDHKKKDNKKDNKKGKKKGNKKENKKENKEDNTNDDLESIKDDLDDDEEEEGVYQKIDNRDDELDQIIINVGKELYNDCPQIIIPDIPDFYENPAFIKLLSTLNATKRETAYQNFVANFFQDNKNDKKYDAFDKPGEKFVQLGKDATAEWKLYKQQYQTLYTSNNPNDNFRLNCNYILINHLVFFDITYTKYSVNIKDKANFLKLINEKSSEYFWGNFNYFPSPYVLYKQDEKCKYIIEHYKNLDKNEFDNFCKQFNATEFRNDKSKEGKKRRKLYNKLSKAQHLLVAKILNSPINDPLRYYILYMKSKSKNKIKEEELILKWNNLENLDKLFFMRACRLDYSNILVREIYEYLKCQKPTKPLSKLHLFFVENSKSNIDKEMKENCYFENLNSTLMKYWEQPEDDDLFREKVLYVLKKIYAYKNHYYKKLVRKTTPIKLTLRQFFFAQCGENVDFGDQSSGISNFTKMTYLMEKLTKEQKDQLIEAHEEFIKMQQIKTFDCKFRIYDMPPLPLLPFQLFCSQNRKNIYSKNIELYYYEKKYIDPIPNLKQIHYSTNEIIEKKLETTFLSTDYVPMFDYDENCKDIGITSKSHYDNKILAYLWFKLKENEKMLFINASNTQFERFEINNNFYNTHGYYYEYMDEGYEDDNLDDEEEDNEEDKNIEKALTQLKNEKAEKEKRN